MTTEEEKTMLDPKDHAVLQVTLRESGAVDMHLASPAKVQAAPKALLYELLSQIVFEEAEPSKAAPVPLPATTPPDEAALREALAKIAVGVPYSGPAVSWDEAGENGRRHAINIAGAILGSLRSRGLLRTPEDARLVADLRTQLDECRAACRKADALEERCANAERAAQERALATIAEKEARWKEWSDKAQADLDAANAEMEQLRAQALEDGARINRLQQDMETTNAQYVRERDARQAAQKEAKDLRTLLSEEQKTLAELREAKEFYERDRAAWHKVALDLEAKAAANHAEVVP